MAATKKYNIEYFVEYAKSRNGTCLSNGFINVSQKLKFICKEGHTFELWGYNAVKGNWCRYCASRKNGVKHRHTLEDAQKVAESRGGKCLEKKYRNKNHSMLWECKEGHRWYASFGNVNRGTWCTRCSRKEVGKKRRKYNIEFYRKIAAEKGGECLSSELKSSRLKLKFRCENGHFFEITGYEIIHKKSWCKICTRGFPNGKSKKYEYEDILKYARKKRGTVITPKSKYKNSNQRIRLQCSEGHMWTTSVGQILRNSTWCRVCSNIEIARQRSYSLEYIKEVALERGGKCLSIEYRGCFHKLEFECSEKHRWKASPAHILRGTWCPRCAQILIGKKNSLSLEELQNYAKSKGGKLISNKYKGVFEIYKWECSNGHTWEAPANSIRQGNWCWQCSSKAKESFGEKACRLVFETIFDTEFPNIRPKWLIGINGHRLELDGYNPQLNLAFEHQGMHHFQEIKIFHYNRSFEEMKIQDEIKRKACKKKNITLIEIPEVGKKTKLKDLKNFIIKQLEKANYHLPKGVEDIRINWQRLHE